MYTYLFRKMYKNLNQCSSALLVDFIKMLMFVNFEIYIINVKQRIVQTFEKWKGQKFKL